MFYITVSNGLLKNGHRKRMGASVWEFMWLIDHITAIDEKGTGKVLGGRPIKLDEIADDLEVHRDTVSGNLITLEKQGYIKKIVTPRGLVITVDKAKKVFGVVRNNSDAPSEKHRRSVGKTPNLYIDSNTIDSNTNNIDQGFEKFWRAYPRKVGKKTAERVWLKIKPDDALLVKMVSSIEKHKKTRQWAESGGIYIPHPTTWLRAERWEDEIQQKVVVSDKFSKIKSIKI